MSPFCQPPYRSILSTQAASFSVLLSLSITLSITVLISPFATQPVWSAEVCPAPLPDFRIDVLIPTLTQGTLPLLSDEDNLKYRDWSYSFRDTIAQQGYPAALDSLRRSYSPLDQVGILLGTLAFRDIENTAANVTLPDNLRLSLMQDALKILRSLAASAQRDSFLQLISYFSINERQVEFVKCQLHRRIILKVISTLFESMRSTIRNLKRRDRNSHEMTTMTLLY